MRHTWKRFCAESSGLRSGVAVIWFWLLPGLTMVVGAASAARPHVEVFLAGTNSLAGRPPVEGLLSIPIKTP